MYVKLCDRCGKLTKNKPAFLVPVSKEKGTYSIDNQWFGEPVCLCDECMEEFISFRYDHKKYKINFVEETNE